MRRAASILAILLAVAACAALPKAPPPHEPPKAVSIVDDQSRRLAHDAEMDRLQERYEEARNELRLARESARGRFILILFVAGAAAAVAGAVMLFFQMKGPGGAALLVGGAMLGAALALDRYADTFALIGLIGFGTIVASGLGLLVWQTIVILRQRAAIASLVQVGEVAKKEAPEAAAAIFGQGGIASRTMPRPVKRIVADFRKRITPNAKESPCSQTPSEPSAGSSSSPSPEPPASGTSG